MRLFAEVVQEVETKNRVWLRCLFLVKDRDWKEVVDVRGRDMVVGKEVVREVDEQEKIRVRLGMVGGENLLDIGKGEDGGREGSGQALMKFLQGLSKGKN